VPDYTDLDRTTNWGGILIERAWLEHTFHPALTVRVGQFLTPFGIWNVDHGSPVIIGTRRPFIVGGGLFPERQTGIEAYGAVSFGPSQLGYHLTLSNGRGPIDTYHDLDNNKAIGWRLFLKQETSFGTFTLGTSGYRGQYSDTHQTFSISPNGRFVASYPIDARYNELGLAADLKWEFGNWLSQLEYVSQDVAYPEKHRPRDPGYSGGPPGYVPDYRQWGGYWLIAYRTPFYNVMPYFGIDYADTGVHSFLHDSIAYWGGLNVRPIPRVVLKAQLTMAHFPHKADDRTYGRLSLIELQAAWSF
jgi:hypothetical protein